MVAEVKLNSLGRFDPVPSFSWKNDLVRRVAKNVLTAGFLGAVGIAAYSIGASPAGLEPKQSSPQEKGSAFPLFVKSVFAIWSAFAIRRIFIDWQKERQEYAKRALAVFNAMKGSKLKTALSLLNRDERAFVRELSGNLFSFPEEQRRSDLNRIKMSRAGELAMGVGVYLSAACRDQPAVSSLLGKGSINSLARKYAAELALNRGDVRLFKVLWGNRDISSGLQQRINKISFEQALESRDYRQIPELMGQLGMEESRRHRMVFDAMRVGDEALIQALMNRDEQWLMQTIDITPDEELPLIDFSRYGEVSVNLCFYLQAQQNRRAAVAALQRTGKIDIRARSSAAEWALMARRAKMLADLLASGPIQSDLRKIHEALALVPEEREGLLSEYLPNMWDSDVCEKISEDDPSKLSETQPTPGASTAHSEPFSQSGGDAIAARFHSRFSPEGLARSQTAFQRSLSRLDAENLFRS